MTSKQELRWSLLRRATLFSLAIAAAGMVTSSSGGTQKITIKGYNATAWGTALGAIIVTDLNGDRKYDYLIRTAKGEDYTDWVLAVLNDGTLLWAKQVLRPVSEYYGLTGFDMDGDGKDEVYASGSDTKKLNPQTGEVLAHAAGSGECIIAYLDGKNPSLCIVGPILEGDANVHYVYAYDKDLKLKWLWNRLPDGGFGTHTILTADVDADGRDEIVMGTIVIDDNGKTMHRKEGTHADVAHVADIDWDNPGLEIACMPYFLDARTGKILWKKDQIVSSYGFVGDIDAKYPGLEIAAMHDANKDAGLPGAYTATWNAKGEKIGAISGKKSAIWWEGTTLQQVMDNPARQFLQCDIQGDWREEMVYVSGATITLISPDGSPKFNRPSLMTNRKYRCDVARGSRGINGKYSQPLISGRITDPPTMLARNDLSGFTPTRLKVSASACPPSGWLLNGARIDPIRLLARKEASSVKRITIITRTDVKP